MKNSWTAYVVFILIAFLDKSVSLLVIPDLVSNDAILQQAFCDVSKHIRQLLKDQGTIRTYEQQNCNLRL